MIAMRCRFSVLSFQAGNFVARKHGSFSPIAMSLVEVVVAIGLFSFVIVAMVGLLSVGLNSSRESSDDTRLALCAQTVFSLLRAEGFAGAQANSEYDKGNTDPDFLFDSGGRLLTDSGGQPLVTSAESYYSCAVTLEPLPLNQPTGKFQCLRLQFFWPPGASVANRSTRNLVMSLADYE